MGGLTAKLLVVDDEPRMAELTAEVLRRAGYTVEVAGNGTEALASARSNAPDLMLLDYELPDMQAPEVLDALPARAIRPAIRCWGSNAARWTTSPKELTVRSCWHAFVERCVSARRRNESWCTVACASIRRGAKCFSNRNC